MFSQKNKTVEIPSLNESPSEKEGKWCAHLVVAYRIGIASMKALLKRKGNVVGGQTSPQDGGASMKALLKRKGNSYPKLARNPAAETGASREPRGGYTQNYTPHPHLPTHSSLTREETMRATHHVPVKRQALAQIQDPHRVLQQATRRGSSRMRGVGAVQVNRANRVSLEVSRDSERTAHQTPSRPERNPGEQRN